MYRCKSLGAHLCQQRANCFVQAVHNKLLSDLHRLTIHVTCVCACAHMKNMELHVSCEGGQRRIHTYNPGNGLVPLDVQHTIVCFFFLF